jgi:hypothetical protein
MENTKKFIYEVNGMRVEFDREPTEADIDDAARQLSGTKSAQPKQDAATANEASFLDRVSKKTLEILSENQEEALGLGALGVGTYLASKLPGVKPAFNTAGEVIKGTIQGGKNIVSGGLQGMFGGPGTTPKGIGMDVARAGGSPLQQTLARGGARTGQFLAEQTAGRLAPMAARAMPMLAGATGAAALPVLAGTASVLGPAYAGYKMYQNYAKMTPLEREQRLMEAQQAGLPGP